MKPSPVGDPPVGRNQRPGLVRFGWELYQHVFAVLGAFSLGEPPGQFPVGSGNERTGSGTAATPETPCVQTNIKQLIDNDAKVTQPDAVDR